MITLPAETMGRLARSAELAAGGCDVEHYLDQIAAEAYVALYPAEAEATPPRSERTSRQQLSEHVRDAITLALLDRDERLEAEGIEAEAMQAAPARRARSGGLLVASADDAEVQP